MCGQARWGACMGISASARSASAGARRIDRRDRVERDHCRHRSSASEREVAKLTVGLGHDVSTVLDIGRQRGSQPRANTSITIRGVEIACFGAAALVAAEPGEAYHNAPFPELVFDAAILEEWAAP